MTTQHNAQNGGLYLPLPLLRTALATTSMLRLEVVGRSMEPLLRLGDAVVVEQVDATVLHRGDIVVTWHAGSLLTHRLLRLGTSCQTKGDHHWACDPPIPAELILGRVVAVHRGQQQIDFRCRGWRFANRLISNISSAQGSFYSWGSSLLHRTSATRTQIVEDQA